jgi:hypothetical protein
MVAIVVAAATVAAPIAPIRDAEHAFDAADHATDTCADRATNRTTDRAGRPIAFV